MAQHVVVALIVVLALLYVGAKYLPQGWRKRIVHKLSRGGRQSPLVQWLDTGSSCGSGCDSCQSCDDTPPQASAPGKHPVIKLHKKQ